MRANDICLVCREKNNFLLETAIHNLERLLSGVKPSETGIRFEWNINLRCRYGMYCNELRQNENRLRRRCEALNSRIMTAAKSDDKMLYENLLRGLQGYFPAVYRQVEKEHRM